MSQSFDSGVLIKCNCSTEFVQITFVIFIGSKTCLYSHPGHQTGLLVSPGLKPKKLSAVSADVDESLHKVSQDRRLGPILLSPSVMEKYTNIQSDRGSLLCAPCSCLNVGKQKYHT